ncbi:MAG: HypC/HybG/HupF family hydrogenase formation chaperone [Candidatus Diapherotrites archaeon]|uniref:HypC/HybG/HupF family hydrogenase formation chaperone n=1 Tax=Candidatus Iainarchaeum sp. TaxID=3101447 RepID=A0A8T4L7K8_9ARCH|nr:HypC/HybG/HupF family hydrogenase formation chaperone [Candidatus Diapherotrites archaeon]
MVAVSRERAVLEQAGKRLEAGIAVEGLGKGDWVLVQQGLVVEVISEAEAREALKAFSEGR